MIFSENRHPLFRIMLERQRRMWGVRPVGFASDNPMT